MYVEARYIFWFLSFFFSPPKLLKSISEKIHTYLLAEKLRKAFLIVNEYGDVGLDINALTKLKVRVGGGS